MSPPELVTDLVGELRAGFDRSFAEPPRRQMGDVEELLALRAGGRAYALRLAETAGLFPDRPVTALPGPVPALLGVAGFSGTVVPVYDLATLLGHPAGPGTAPPRWLVLAAGTPPLAVAFHELDGHLRVPAETVVAEPAGPRRGGPLRGMVPLSDGTRPIVDVPAVRAVVTALVGGRPPSENGDDIDG